MTYVLTLVPLALLVNILCFIAGVVFAGSISLWLNARLRATIRQLTALPDA